MDIYSNHKIPFNLGVWARSHKFSPTAVQMTRDLKLIANLEQQRAALEKAIDAAEGALRATLAKAEQQLEDSPSGY